MSACVHLLYYHINLYISFIYDDIFAKFPENVYGCENMSVQNFVIILKNNIATIAECSEIINML